MTSIATPPKGTVLTLVAPLSGVVVPIDAVPDPAFAQRLAGDGVAIDPLSDRVLAPCDARVLQVHRANHAVTLAVQGLEILVHVGLDTVELKGEGFTALVKAGDEVRAGDPLITFDADRVARRARSLISPVLVTNPDRVVSIAPVSGVVTAGRDVLMRLTLGGAEAGAAPAPEGERAESAPIVVRDPAGLHARPAAVLANAARRFTADLRLVKDSSEANLRSLVSIMSLEVGAGDAVRVVARGADAKAAVKTLSELLASGLPSGPAPAAAAGARAAEPVATIPAVPAPAGVMRGVAASPGVAVGNVFRMHHADVAVEERAGDPNQERRALDTALATARQQLEALRTRLAGEADADRAAIFAAHEELLEDPEVLDRAIAGIRAGQTAAFAWRAAYTGQADRLLALKSAVLAGRAADLRDVGRRVLYLLVGVENAPQREVPPDSIVVAEELTPSDTASLDRTRVRGLCTTSGSATSHVAILARGLGIPAVAGMDPRVLDLAPGTRVVLDGDAGLLRPGPTEAEEREIARRRKADEERRAAELAAAAEPATTRDGHRVEVAANLGDAREAPRAVEVGGEGVGLLRTEFLFMDRHEAPDEEEQTRVYESIARALGPDRILVIRTLDVGGDKPLPYLPVGVEANPFLGERGVRLSLARPELFRTQIRAILRASRSGKVAMMFPMIATIAEWSAARAMVEGERQALGLPPIPVGIMVETAAAALIAERFAREADFLSIGTNDLTQYALAMDRTNPRLAAQVDALHPAVLRLIQQTVEGAHRHGRWVGVCGALAGDTAAVPVLVGLGVDELSTDIPIVPAVKARVRTLSLAECQRTAREALEAGDGAEVRALVARRHG